MRTGYTPFPKVESESSGRLPPRRKTRHRLKSGNAFVQRIRDWIPWQAPRIQSDSLYVKSVRLWLRCSGESLWANLPNTACRDRPFARECGTRDEALSGRASFLGIKISPMPLSGGHHRRMFIASASSDQRPMQLSMDICGTTAQPWRGNSQHLVPKHSQSYWSGPMPDYGSRS